MKYLYIFVFSMFIMYCSRISQPELFFVDDYSYLQKKKNKALIVVNIIVSSLPSNYENNLPKPLEHVLKHYNYELAFIEKLIQVLYQYDRNGTFQVDLTQDLEENNVKYRPFIGGVYPLEIVSKGYDLIIETDLRLFCMYELDYLKITQQLYVRLLNTETQKVYISQERVTSYKIPINFSNIESKDIVLEQIILSRLNYSILDITSFLLRLDYKIL